MRRGLDWAMGSSGLPGGLMDRRSALMVASAFSAANGETKRACQCFALADIHDLPLHTSVESLKLYGS